MKKDPSNSSAESGDNTLPKSTILRGRKNFERLFRKRAVTFRNDYVNLRFQVITGSTEGCKMGFVVKKKLGNAVRRNRIKRLLRDAYRKHSHIISDICKENKFSFQGALMAQSADSDITYGLIESDVTDLLLRTRKYLLSNTEDSI